MSKRSAKYYLKSEKFQIKCILYNAQGSPWALYFNLFLVTDSSNGLMSKRDTTGFHGERNDK